MKRISMLVGLALPMLPLSAAVAQQDESDKIPQFVKAKEAHHSPDIGKWVYFVSNDPIFAVFTVEDIAGEAHYTSPDQGNYVVKSMKLKYIGDDKTGLYYQYQNDVGAGGLVWFLPKAKRGYVYWMYGGTETPEYQILGPSVRYHPK